MVVERWSWAVVVVYLTLAMAGCLGTLEPEDDLTSSAESEKHDGLVAEQEGQPEDDFTSSNESEAESEAQDGLVAGEEGRYPVHFNGSGSARVNIEMGVAADVTAEIGFANGTTAANTTFPTEGAVAVKLGTLREDKPVVAHSFFWIDTHYEEVVGDGLWGSSDPVIVDTPLTSDQNETWYAWVYSNVPELTVHVHVGSDDTMIDSLGVDLDPVGKAVVRHWTFDAFDEGRQFGPLAHDTVGLTLRDENETSFEPGFFVLTRTWVAYQHDANVVRSYVLSGGTDERDRCPSYSVIGYDLRQYVEDNDRTVTSFGAHNGYRDWSSRGTLCAAFHATGSGEIELLGGGFDFMFLPFDL